MNTLLVFLQNFLCYLDMLTLSFIHWSYNRSSHHYGRRWELEILQKKKDQGVLSYNLQHLSWSWILLKDCNLFVTRGLCNVFYSFYPLMQIGEWCFEENEREDPWNSKLPCFFSCSSGSILSFFLLMTRIYDAPNGFANFFANSFLLIIDLCETLYPRWKECCVRGDSTSFYHSCYQYLCSSSGDKDAW